jgi:hypothetical protein
VNIPARIVDYVLAVAQDKGRGRHGDTERGRHEDTETGLFSPSPAHPLFMSPPPVLSPNEVAL